MSLKWRVRVGHPPAIWHGMAPAAVPRPDENRKTQRSLWIVTPAVSMKRQKKNLVVTNLVIIKRRTRGGRGRLSLYRHENSVRKGNGRRYLEEIMATFVVSFELELTGFRRLFLYLLTSRYLHCLSR